MTDEEDDRRSEQEGIREDVRQAVAARMLCDGMSDEIISKYTELPVWKIAAERNRIMRIAQEKHEKAIRLIRKAENSNEHMEIIAGKEVIENDTAVEHHSIVVSLADALNRYMTEHEYPAVVFAETAGLYVNDVCEDIFDYYLPDVMVVSNLKEVDGKGIHCAPVFVAEVDSPTSRGHNYTSKMAVYGKMGVKEYWVINTKQRKVYQYVLEDDYAPNIFPDTSRMISSALPSLEIDLSMFVNSEGDPDDNRKE